VRRSTPPDGPLTSVAWRLRLPRTGKDVQGARVPGADGREADDLAADGPAANGRVADGLVEAGLVETGLVEAGRAAGRAGAGVDTRNPACVLYLLTAFNVSFSSGVHPRTEAAGARRRY
jgi:hypothetical protein